MKITYLAHSCFLIQTQGKKIVTDPYESGSYGGSVSYEPVDVEADIVTISHQHFDHNASKEVGGRPYIKDSPGVEEFAGLKIRGIKSFHDAQEGRQRGENTIYVYEAEGLRLVHLGDQGVIPPGDILEQLKDTDVLLIPVGGFFTIGPQEAKEIIETLKPHIVIPMHYKTKKLGFDIKPLEDFLKVNRDKDIQKQEGFLLEIGKDNLPPPVRIVVLKYAR